MVQLVPVLIDAAQLLVCAKSPLAVMPLMANVALPLFVRATVCAGLTVPRFW
jgi:hypothetical protein